MIATRLMLGAISVSNSSNLPAIWPSEWMKPVILPPGRGSPRAEGCRRPVETIPLRKRDMSHVRLAKAGRRLDQRIEHHLQIERRAADDLEHVGCGGLLLQRFAQFIEEAR